MFQILSDFTRSGQPGLVDGNKRTALGVAINFMLMNGYTLDQAKGVEHAEMMEQLGQDKITRDQAAAHLQEHSRQISPVEPVQPI